MRHAMYSLCAKLERHFVGIVPNGVMAPRVQFTHRVSEMGWEPLEPVPGGEEQALRAPCAADSQGGADTQADVQSLPVAEDATGVALCPVSDS